MARTIRRRFHRPLPGGGADSGGSPKQGKVEVVGEINVTTYAGVESLTPADIGLVTIDWIDIKHENAAGGKEGSEPRDVRYCWSSQDFYIRETEARANAGTHVLYFKAFGDTVRNAELL
jgi:hypothetical protein